MSRCISWSIGSRPSCSTSRRFADDNYYDDFIPVWLGEGFEATLWGMKMCYDPAKDPWIDRRPVIASETDIHRLPRPDFGSQGLMPLAKRFHHELLAAVEPFGMSVGFQNWGNGPLMTANYLAGMEPLAMAFLDQPEFARALLDYVTDCRIAWTAAAGEVSRRTGGQGRNPRR